MRGPDRRVRRRRSAYQQTPLIQRSTAHAGRRRASARGARRRRRVTAGRRTRRSAPAPAVTGRRARSPHARPAAATAAPGRPRPARSASAGAAIGTGAVAVRVRRSAARPGGRRGAARGRRARRRPATPGDAARPARATSGRPSRRRAGGSSGSAIATEMHHRAGERAGDAGHELDLADDHLAELVDAVRLGEHDHVVRAGDRVDPDHSGDIPDRGGHVTRLSDLGLDEDVRLDHDTTPIRRRATRLARETTVRTASARRMGRRPHERGQRTHDRRRDGRVRADRPGHRAAGGRAGDACSARATTRRWWPRRTAGWWPPPTCSSRAGTSGGTGRAPRDVGHRAAAANLADIAAMGAVPTALLVALCAPPDLDVRLGRGAGRRAGRRGGAGRRRAWSAATCRPARR